MAELLLQYLTEKLPSLDDLYCDPWTCQAIFRTLPPLAKQYIMRLLYLNNKEFSTHSLKRWAASTEEGLQQHALAIQRLQSLRILLLEQKLVESRKKGGAAMRPFLKINPIFQQQLQKAVSNSQASPWTSTELKPEKHPPSLEMLQTFSRVQWESVLSKLFGGKTDIKIITLFQQLGLIVGEFISPKGYQFLFQDSFSQIWLLLEGHLHHSENKIELLAFLFQLSFLTVGNDYEMAVLTESQKEFVKLLAEFGLIYRTKGSRRYYPTQLAVSLMSGEAVIKKEGFIVAETNHHIYAYCKSTLAIKILSLITKMRVRLPNLVVGKITRESIRNAFEKGISGSQIIQFLEQNTHPETRKLEFPIPETLIHQIELWEREENAVIPSAGCLYERFSSSEEYMTLKQFAASAEILLWFNDVTQLLFISQPGIISFEERRAQLGG